MKRLFSLCLAVLFCVLATSCGAVGKPPLEKHVVASVNGVIITETQLEERVLHNEIWNDAYKRLFDAVYTDEMQKEMAYSGVVVSVKKNEVLNEMIIAEVIRQDLEENKMLITKAKTKEAFDSEYELMKTDESQREFYEALTAALEAKGISESRFRELKLDESHDKLNMIVARTQFSESADYDESSQTPFEVQFEEYCEELKNRSKTIYKAV